MRPLGSLALLFFITGALSKVLPVDERCVTAVYTAYTYITFAGRYSRKYLEARCENPLQVTSIYASSDIHCQPHERSIGLSQLEGVCRDAGLELIPREELAENLTEDALKLMHKVDYLELSGGDVMDKPVLLTPEHYRRVFLTLDIWAFEMWTHYTYGYLSYLYWGCILLIGTLYRAIDHFVFSKHHTPSQHSAQSHLPFRRIYHWFQTHFLVATTIPSEGREFFWWTFSNRTEALATIGFWILSIVTTFIGYRLSTENIYWPDYFSQAARYAADRTGIVSFANLPLLWLFAGRNNICAWATGWNFATFNVFHRHVAWIATIQAVAHTVLYLILFFQNANPWKSLSKPYLLWGTLATLLMVFILPAAITWFRHRAYETFLLIHIVFSIGVLVGCFYHTIIFEDQAYWFYLWPTVGIWAFDRVLRVVRVIYYNLHVRKNLKSLHGTTSIATYNKAADLLRLELIPGSNSLDPRPGQYYFLYQPFRLTGWESHPFTLGSWSYELGLGSSLRTPTNIKGDENVDVSQIPLLSDSSSSGSRTPQTDLSQSASRQLRLVFWIRPYDGWTRHLRQECLKSPDRTSNATILLEGPYGHEFPLWTYESVLLIAGGTGIASAVPYINGHIARSSTSEEKNKTRVQDMHLVWVTRQPAFIDDLASRELSPALERDDIHASFYATSPLARWERQSQSSNASTTDIPTLPAADSVPDVDILQGRPNLDKIISTFAEEAHNSDSSAAVLVCGPSRMADEARAAVYSAMKRGFEMRYVEESFTW
ncbi:ferric reductase like transmembrane component-domain-containing protein [Aspergillus karnatakaensis]|uniref:ferric reductase family protein n=1 Tax=Aspergillus karnatakaensis TaxID=1810916 RepID=UPI003CCD7FBC